MYETVISSPLWNRFVVAITKEFETEYLFESYNRKSSYEEKFQRVKRYRIAKMENDRVYENIIEGYRAALKIACTQIRAIEDREERKIPDPCPPTARRKVTFEAIGIDREVLDRYRLPCGISKLTYSMADREQQLRERLRTYSSRESRSTQVSPTTQTKIESRTSPTVLSKIEKKTESAGPSKSTKDRAKERPKITKEKDRSPEKEKVTPTKPEGAMTKLFKTIPKQYTPPANVTPKKTAVVHEIEGEINKFISRKRTTPSKPEHVKKPPVEEEPIEIEDNDEIELNISKQSSSTQMSKSTEDTSSCSCSDEEAEPPAKKSPERKPVAERTTKDGEENIAKSKKTKYTEARRSK